MFDYFFVARRDYSDGGRPTVEVAECFPKPKEDLLKEHPNVAMFCFPETTAAVAQLTTRFTFTLTNASGKWLYGFCVRPHEPNAQSDTLQCLCILSSNPWFELFYETLGYAAVHPIDQAVHVVDSLSKVTPMPEPGMRFSVGDEGNRFSVTRPPQVFPLADAALPDFFATFGLTGSLDLVSAVLSEQRVLIVGDNLDAVTGCIHALTAVLHPFEWHHPFVPVLPPTMLDAVCSPTPFIMGIHAELHAKALKLPTESLIIGEVGSGRVSGLDAEGRQAIPTSVGRLRDRLKEILERKGQMKSERCLAILTSFTDFYVGLFGRVREYEIRGADRKGEPIADIDEARFLSSLSGDRKIQRFAQAFIKTQMFDMWKQELPSYAKEGKACTFADRAALKYPQLWVGYGGNAALGLPAPKKDGNSVLARFIAGRDKLKKELDKKLNNSNQSPVHVRTPSPFHQDPSMSPTTTQSPVVGSSRHSPGSPSDGSWVHNSPRPAAASRLRVDVQTPVAFPTLHRSLDPFSMYPREISVVVQITKINGMVGCSYLRNRLEAVMKGAAADRAGLKPGMRITELNGRPLTEESSSHDVKEAFSLAPSVFSLTLHGAATLFEGVAGVSPEPPEELLFPAETNLPEMPEEAPVCASPSEQPPAPSPSPPLLDEVAIPQKLASAADELASIFSAGPSCSATHSSASATPRSPDAVSPTQPPPPCTKRDVFATLIAPARASPATVGAGAELADFLDAPEPEPEPEPQANVPVDLNDMFAPVPPSSSSPAGPPKNAAPARALSAADVFPF
eukprot:TRINITY_DN10151_c0_g1_i2.p1 TRINITY_DN10151_c0_g1~~TRINITY_DN10151_c0_g1_i2.p1  ORF type:complete len:792 (+),score=241.35 TRINITY_DN10151_c0_g1_i2:170-2545(+)